MSLLGALQFPGRMTDMGLSVFNLSYIYLSHELCLGKLCACFNLSSMN